MKGTRVAMIGGLALAAAAAIGAVCGEPAAPNAAQTPALGAATALPPYNAGALLSTFEASVTSFDEFPILWLGEFYDSDGDGIGDMRISSAFASHGRPFIDPLTGKELSPAITSFNISYGTCEIPPKSQSCPIPISIMFYPVDTAAAPDAVSFGSGPTERLRGVDARIYDSSKLWFATADMEFSISASGTGQPREQARRIASLLYGANAKAASITKDSDFRPKPPPPPTPFPTDPPAPPTRTPTPFPIMTQAPGDAQPTADVATALPAPVQ